MSTPALRLSSSYPAIVGAVVKRLRDRKGLDQAEVASALGTSQSTWSRIERGSLALSLEQLIAVADALGTTPGEILTHADTAAKRIRARGVNVANDRTERVLSDGEIAIGAAALLLLVIAVLSSKK